MSDDGKRFTVEDLVEDLSLANEVAEEFYYVFDEEGHSFRVEQYDAHGRVIRQYRMTVSIEEVGA